MVFLVVHFCSMENSPAEDSDTLESDKKYSDIERLMMIGMKFS